MYIHQPVQISFNELTGGNELIRLVAAISISCVVYEVISKNLFTKKILLGIVRETDK